MCKVGFFEVKEFEYISNQRSLAKALDTIGSQKVIGLDLEFDNNSFTYGMNLCLIQVGLENKESFLIDPIELGDFGGVFEILADPEVRKIIHSASEDVNVIQSLGGRVIHISDTEKLARLAGMERTGLGDLLMFFFGVRLEKELQRSNWNLRPLSKELLDYSAQDVRWLIELEDELIKIIDEKGIGSWIDPVMRTLENDYHSLKRNGSPKVKGLSQMDPVPRARAEVLLEVREKYAKELNLPPHKVIKNFLIPEIASYKQLNYSRWKKTKALGEVAKGQGFFDSYKEKLEQMEKSGFTRASEGKPRLRVEPKIFQKRVKLLERFRDRMVEAGGVEASRLVLSNARVNEAAISGSIQKIDPYFLKTYAWNTEDEKEAFQQNFGF